MANKIPNINIFENVLTEEEFIKIKNMVNDFTKKKSMELEVSFRDVNYANYMRIKDYYVDNVDENDIEASDSLDVSVTLDNGNTYRVSIYDVDNINDFIRTFANKSIIDIQKYLLSLKTGEDLEIMFKDRGSANRVYLEDYGIVFKLTSEIPITDDADKPKLKGTERMLYRYKKRYGFKINKNAKVDITVVQESSTLRDLTKKRHQYEIELEFINNNINIELFFNEVTSILSVVQDSEIPIGKKESISVLQKYQKLLGLKIIGHLESRNVVSIEAQHIVKFVPNKYAITDKADGERYFLFSIDSGLYLISTNSIVKKVAIQIENPLYHNMIIDGELIQNNNNKNYLAFDVIYAQEIDYRYNDTYNLVHRLDVLSDIIDKCFGNLIPFNDYTDKNNDMDLNKIKSFYTKELQTYWSLFNKKTSKYDGMFISKKLYFIPYGFDSSEVFMYADLVWKLYVYSKLTPYKLDGIIYTPINSPYIISAGPDGFDSVPMEYKWKSPLQNSIDFFIKFKKDENGNDAIFYDEAVVHADASAYKVCNLYVGLPKGNQEKVIPFKVNGVEQKANIYLTDGEVVDNEGDVINDQTVVEFIFDNTKPDIDDAYKWIPLRTRYDKTESVQKYGRKYGNNLHIAVRIWKTIVNPVTEENIASLGNPSSYQKEIERLSKNLEYNKQNFVYYQKKTANAAGMRAFNNWIKSNMIMTYCSGKYNVLDIGCGRGGDLRKFIYSGIGEYVGVDVDQNGLFTISDSALNRYKNFKKTLKKVPPMYFIHADARARFNVKSQESVIPNMNELNKKLIETHLSANKKYDVINAQFTLHYYLSDELSWSNFCKNIRDHLQPNGYFLITCFDGQIIYDRLLGKPKMTVSYTDNNGKKNVFFEIVKVYADDDKTKNELGLAIDLYNSLISNPGTYIREYLVFPDFLEKSLKECCGLELVETDTFFNLFNLYKNYFLTNEINDISMADISSKRYQEIKNFYTSLHPSTHTDVDADAAIASFKFTMLNRYYIFKKTTPIDITEPSRIVGINHKIDLGYLFTPYFNTNNIIIDPTKKTTQINKIYHAIRRKYTSIRPSVYLIRHSIMEDNIGDDNIYYRNKFEFSKIKEGTDQKLLLIYKSPEKYFYPIFYQNQQDDFPEEFLQMRVAKYVTPESVISNGTYLIDSDKIVNDLDIMVALSDKLNKK